VFPAFEPLRNVLTGIQYNHTSQPIGWDEANHGTMVAGFWYSVREFNLSITDHYIAKARIAVIKSYP